MTKKMEPKWYKNKENQPAIITGVFTLLAVIITGVSVYLSSFSGSQADSRSIQQESVSDSVPILTEHEKIVLSDLRKKVSGLGDFVWAVSYRNNLTGRVGLSEHQVTQCLSTLESEGLIECRLEEETELKWGKMAVYRLTRKGLQYWVEYLAELSEIKIRKGEK